MGVHTHESVGLKQKSACHSGSGSPVQQVVALVPQLTFHVSVSLCSSSMLAVLAMSPISERVIQLVPGLVRGYSWSSPMVGRMALSNSCRWGSMCGRSTGLPLLTFPDLASSLGHVLELRRWHRVCLTWTSWTVLSKRNEEWPEALWKLPSMLRGGI